MSIIQPTLNESASIFRENALDGLHIEHVQDIPQEFVSQLKGMKADSGSVREKEFMHVASIPEVIHLKWLKEGYDCTKEPIRETVKKLHREGLDAFHVTNKRI